LTIPQGQFWRSPQGNMPQGDYDEALKRALYISAEWLKIFNTGKEGCRVVGMLMQDGWDAAAMGTVL